MSIRIRISAVIVPLFAIASLPALAQENGPASTSPSDTQLEEVVITATRTAKGISEAPASVSVVTSDQIESKNIQRVDEALTALPGVYLRGPGDHVPSAWANTVTMRGIAGYERTAVLLDGQPINNAFSGGVNWSSLAVEDIQKIEVVPGPFSSLYGGNAMGGVINIISKIPEKREFTVKGGYGSNALRSANIAFADRISDNFGLSANVGYKDSDGYVSDYVIKRASAGAGAIPVTGWERSTDPYGTTTYLLGDKGEKPWWQQNAGLKLFYNINPSSRLSMGVSYHEHETDFDRHHTYLRDTSGNPVNSGNIGIDDGAAQRINLTENDFLFGPNGETVRRYSLGYEGTLTGDMTLKTDVYYSDNGYWYVSQLTGATQDGGAGKLVDIPNTKAGVSAQLSFPVTDKQLVVAGLSVGRDTLDKKEYDLASWRATDARGAVRYEADGESQTYALFVRTRSP